MLNRKKDKDQNLNSNRINIKVKESEKKYSEYKSLKRRNIEDRRCKVIPH